MRDSINGAWLYSIVLVFIVVFIAFVCISINYANAFKIKTNLITIIEEYNGVNGKSILKMKKNIKGVGYKQLGYCKSEPGINYVGIGDTNETANANKNPTKKQHACIYREQAARATLPGDYVDGGLSAYVPDRYYYTVEVFFPFNLPILGEVYTFTVSGETNAVKYPNDESYF